MQSPAPSWSSPLVDSTSFGTLLIPIWFLLTPGRVATGRVLVFLGTVAMFYLAVGIALLLGLGAALSNLDSLLDKPVVASAQLVLGVGLLVWSFFIGRSRNRGTGRGRLVRWRDRVMGGDGSAGMAGLVTLALSAALVEGATMLPYLAAIGLLGTADVDPVLRILTLAVYCLVMVLPALLLLGLRLVARRAIEPVLHRIARWFEKSSGEMTAWVVAIVGFLIARDAVVRIPGVVKFLDSW